MKVSPWIGGGIVVAFLAGMAFALAGLWMPGKIVPGESVGGVSKSALTEAKQKAEGYRKTREKLVREVEGLQGLTGEEGEHRVFVSAQLVYLPGNAEPVQPLDRKMKTEDGLEVGWKMKYRLDPADPGIKDGDPDGDGFTNLEEFLSRTDPTLKSDSPAKESKLKSRSGDPVAMAVSFPEKSGGLYTLRFQVGTKRREFKGKPGDSFWLMAGPDGVEVFSEQGKMKAARDKAKDSGQNSHVIPLKFASYEERVEKIKDQKAGGVEVEVDNSVVMLERGDALQGPQKLIFSTPQRPHPLSWDVGEIRFFTPVSGGTEVGPFRVGESFSFEGKEFAVIGREGKKIHIRNLTEAGKEPFWVPPENSSPENPATP